MRRINIAHTTEYQYAEPVTLLPHHLLLRPREGHDIRIESSRLDIAPAHDIRWTRDVYGNIVAQVDFKERSARLTVTSEVLVQHYANPLFEFARASIATQFPFAYGQSERDDLLHYQKLIFPNDESLVRAFIGPLWQDSKSMETTSLLDTLNAKIANQIAYEIREAPGVQSPATTLARGRGSCRDVATLFMEVCRACGFAARFVSGYLVSSPMPQGTQSTHAWSEVYLPDGGWRGFDSTSGLQVGPEHIAVAVHRHPESVPPVAGAFVGASYPAPTLAVHVTTTVLTTA